MVDVVFRDPRETPVLLDQLALEVNPDLRVHLASLGHQVVVGQVETRCQAHPVYPEPWDPWDNVANLESKVMLVPLVAKVCPVHVGTKVTEGPQALLALTELRENKEEWDPRVLMAVRASQVCRG